MRIIVPRSNSSPNTTNNPSSNTATNNTDQPATQQELTAIPSIVPTNNTFSNTTTTPRTHSYGMSPRDFNYETGEQQPRRRKQSKKHKSSSTSSPNAVSYYSSNTELDDGYNSSDEHSGSYKPASLTSQPPQITPPSCGAGLISEVSSTDK